MPDSYLIPPSDLHSRSVRTLIFNQLSDERDGDEVFECLAQSLKHCHFDYVLFTDYDKHFDGTGTLLGTLSYQFDLHHGNREEP